MHTKTWKQANSKAPKIARAAANAAGLFFTAQLQNAERACFRQGGTVQRLRTFRRLLDGSFATNIETVATVGR